MDIGPAHRFAIDPLLGVRASDLGAEAPEDPAPKAGATPGPGGQPLRKGRPRLASRGRRWIPGVVRRMSWLGLRLGFPVGRGVKHEGGETVSRARTSQAAAPRRKFDGYRRRPIPLPPLDASCLSESLPSFVEKEFTEYDAAQRQELQNLNHACGGRSLEQGVRPNGYHCFTG
jgi:hypothetical protein